LLKRFETFTYAVSGIYRDIQKIEREEMETYGLKGGYAQYLLAMTRFPEGVTAAELCEICDKDKAAVSRVVSELEAKGLLLRQNSGNNAYRAKLVLTDLGLQTAEFVQRRASIAVELAGQGLGDEERRIFYAALERIANNLRRIGEEGIPNRKENNGEI